MDRDSNSSHRALVLHDQPLMIDLIGLTLNHALFDVRGAGTLAEVTAILADWRPSLAVVDMENHDSGELLHLLGTSSTLRRSDTPVLGLTRRGDLATKLRAFELGVDDILTVPFSPEELVARSIVIIRRVTGTERPVIPTIRLGELEIDIFKREVRTGTSIIHLSSVEQSLLYLFASQAGRVLSREDILDGVWGTDFLAESNVADRHVRSLRVKLQNDYRRPRFIATVPGQGYRFIPTFTNLGWVDGQEPGRSD